MWKVRRGGGGGGRGVGGGERERARARASEREREREREGGGGCKARETEVLVQRTEGKDRRDPMKAKEAVRTQQAMPTIWNTSCTRCTSRRRRTFSKKLEGKLYKKGSRPAPKRAARHESRAMEAVALPCTKHRSDYDFLEFARNCLVNKGYMDCKN